MLRICLFGRAEGSYRQTRMEKIGLTAHFSLLTGPETKIEGHELFRPMRAKKGQKTAFSERRSNMGEMYTTQSLWKKRLLRLTAMG